MNELIYPTIDAALVKVVGIFDYDKKFASSLEKEFGYTATPAIDYANAQFYRDKYYMEFNEIMLLCHLLFPLPIVVHLVLILLYWLL